MSAISRTVGVYGEAYIQFELARMGWVVDAIGATANGIDLTAWKFGEPGRGINVKARKRESRTAVTLYKDEAHMEAMRGECKLRGVEPYVAVVVFTDAGNRGYLMHLSIFLARYRRIGRNVAYKGIDFYRTPEDEQRYEGDPDVIKFR